MFLLIKQETKWYGWIVRQTRSKFHVPKCNLV